jgi:hypothetical protein
MMNTKASISMAATRPSFREKEAPHAPGPTLASPGVSRSTLVKWSLGYLYVTALIIAAILILFTAGGALVDWLLGPVEGRTLNALLSGIVGAVKDVNSSTFGMMLLGGLPAVAFASLPGYLIERTRAAWGVRSTSSELDGDGFADEDDLDSGDSGGPQLNPYGNLTPDGQIGIYTDPSSDSSHLT